MARQCAGARGKKLQVSLEVSQAHSEWGSCCKVTPKVRTLTTITHASMTCDAALTDNITGPVGGRLLNMVLQSLRISHDAR